MLRMVLATTVFRLSLISNIVGKASGKSTKNSGETCDYGDSGKPVDSGKSGESCYSSESDAPVDFCESGDSGVYGAVLLAILVILMNL